MLANKVMQIEAPYQIATGERVNNRIRPRKNSSTPMFRPAATQMTGRNILYGMMSDNANSGTQVHWASLSKPI